MPATPVPSLVANCTVTSPALPPLRVSVTVAAPADCGKTNTGPANSMKPPASLSVMVSVAWAGGTMLTVAGVGLPSVSSTVRLPVASESLRIGTVNVFVPVPAGKLRVPATAW